MMATHQGHTHNQDLPPTNNSTHICSRSFVKLVRNEGLRVAVYDIGWKGVLVGWHEDKGTKQSKGEMFVRRRG